MHQERHRRHRIYLGAEQPHEREPLPSEATNNAADRRPNVRERLAEAHLVGAVEAELQVKLSRNAAVVVVQDRVDLLGVPVLGARAIVV